MQIFTYLWCPTLTMWLPTGCTSPLWARWQKPPTRRRKSNQAWIFWSPSCRSWWRSSSLSSDLSKNVKTQHWQMFPVTTQICFCPSPACSKRWWKKESGRKTEKENIFLWKVWRIKTRSEDVMVANSLCLLDICVALVRCNKSLWVWVWGHQGHVQPHHRGRTLFQRIEETPVAHVWWWLSCFKHQDQTIQQLEIGLHWGFFSST